MRRPSIADILIVIVAVALGMLILRAYLPGHDRQLRFVGTAIRDPTGLWRFHEWAYGPASCLVVPLMAAVIVMRLRRPRPRRSRLVNQPGLVTCVAVMASLIPGLICVAVVYHRPGFQRAEGFQQAWVVAIRWAYTAVIGSWLALGLSRRWRPERSWIDRAGRALGLYWILLALTVVAIPWVEKIQRIFANGGAL
jgi:hypothetical protein